MATHDEFEQARKEAVAKIQEVIRDVAALSISASDRSKIDIDLRSAIHRINLAPPDFLTLPTD